MINGHPKCAELFLKHVYQSKMAADQLTPLLLAQKKFREKYYSQLAIYAAVSAGNESCVLVYYIRLQQNKEKFNPKQLHDLLNGSGENWSPTIEGLEKKSKAEQSEGNEFKVGIRTCLEIFERYKDIILGTSLAASGKENRTDKEEKEAVPLNSSPKPLSLSS